VPAARPVLALQRSIGNRAVARLLARQPNVGVNADDRHVDVVSSDVGGVGDVDVGWYRRLNEAKLGGRLRVDPGSIYKDPTDLRVDVTGLHPPGSDQLVLHGTVHLDGFDAVRGEMTVRLRYKDPSRLWQAARATTPDELWKRLEQVLHEAVPGLDAAKLADELKGLLGQLASGKLSVEAFVKAVEQSARRAAQGANVDPIEQALWRFLAEVGPELEATGVLVAGDETIAKLHGSLRFTSKGPEAEYGARGVILAPPGAVTSTWAPAIGSFEETQTLRVHKRFMYGILQKLDTDALGRQGALFVEKFPTSGYLEYTHATRYGDDLEVGIRLGVRASTSDIAHYVPHEQPKLTAADQRRNLIGSYQDTFTPRTRDGSLAPLAELVPPLPAAIPYNIGVTIFGTFNWLGGKGPGTR
jgi:hypothetical protein